MKQPSSRIPKFGDWLLRLLARYDINPHLRGDFNEEFSLIYEAKGFFRAWFWYWTHLLRSLPFFTRDMLFWRFVMLKNYLKVALRNIKRFKGYFFINTTGLTIGMTCGMLIFLYVQYELSYDRYHENAKNIYRAVSCMSNIKRMDSSDYSNTPPPLAQVMVEEFPEVINTTQVCKKSGLVQYENKSFNEDKFFFAEPSFLEIFSFPLITGNPETVLKEPFTVLLTEGMSKKYFGDEDPVNKIIKYRREGVNHDFKITGVLKNVPKNSHFKFDFLASFPTLSSLLNYNWNQWFPPQFKIYAHLQENADPSALEKKIEDFLINIQGEKRYKILLQPLKSIHLHSHLNLEFEENSDIMYVYLFSGIGFFIILIACFNYMNLSTACSLSRSKEIGLRKVMGANRSCLIKQFLVESMLLAGLASAGSIFLVRGILPALNSFIKRDISFNLFKDPMMFLSLTIFTILIGVFSGSYPAFFLSSFRPTNAIKDSLKLGVKSSSTLRSSLVVIQFVISAVLIICTFVVAKQLNYIKNKGFGLKKEQIVTLNIEDENLRKNYFRLKNELSQHSQILGITVSSKLPNTIDSIGGAISRETVPELVYRCFIDSDFFDFYDINLLEGRAFSEKHSIDLEQQTIILNEAAVKAYDLENPVGQSLNFQGHKEIIGVIKDFHFHSLHHKIKPLIFIFLKNRGYYFSINVNSEGISRTLSLIEKTFKKYSPDYPFEYSFLDETVERMYHAERKLGQALICFTSVALFISCLGLFGLVSFSTERRTKEIGIRKVLGASIPSILHIFWSEYILKIMLANFIAWPIAFFFMSRWLQNFVYRTHLKFWIFLISTAIALLITFLTVSYQTIKTATADPVDSLRYE